MMSLADDVIGTIHTNPIESFWLIRHFLERGVKNRPAFGGVGGFGPSDDNRHCVLPAWGLVMLTVSFVGSGPLADLGITDLWTNLRTLPCYSA
jgi:hypothetical protein